MMETLYKEAADLACRSVEVEKTTDGQYIVLFLVMGQSPPPKGKTEKEALEVFIAWAKARPIVDLPEVDLHRPDPRDTASEF